MSWLLVLQFICKYSNSEIIVTTFQFPPKRWYRKNFGSIVKRILLSPIKQKKTSFGNIPYPRFTLYKQFAESASPTLALLAPSGDIQAVIDGHCISVSGVLRANLNALHLVCF